MDYREEENNYPKAFLLTGILLAVFFLICYIIILPPAPKQEDGTGGILVNYGTVDEGMGNDYMSTEEPSVAEKANHTKPDKVTPAPPSEDKPTPQASEKTVVTQNTEDAPEVAAPTKKPTTAVATPQPTKTVAKPVVNQNALYKGKATTGTGEGDGTGNKPGNQGKPDGSTLANNYNGTGSGNGGLRMAQRSFITRPDVKNTNRVSGKVVIYLQADKQGNVISAQAGKGTTVADYATIKECENTVMQLKLNSAENAPDTQQGTYTFNFKLE